MLLSSQADYYYRSLYPWRLCRSERSSAVTVFSRVIVVFGLIIILIIVLVFIIIVLVFFIVLVFIFFVIFFVIFIIIVLFIIIVFFVIAGHSISHFHGSYASLLNLLFITVVSENTV